MFEMDVGDGGRTSCKSITELETSSGADTGVAEEVRKRLAGCGSNGGLKSSGDEGGRLREVYCV